VGPGAGREVMPLPADPPAPEPPPTLVWLEVAALLACCEHTPHRVSNVDGGGAMLPPDGYRFQSG
jgi:hypothetical protein